VRLRRLRAAVFGPHRDRNLDLDADVVLVFGRNESGKSCFREAVETVLYGFEPAKRESHLLYQWNEGRGGDLHVEADFTLDDGTAARVERVLQAKGTSRMANEGEAFEGARQGNSPLSFVADLPRKLFQSIYSIDIEQLAALGAGVQEHVDDLLLPETESLGLRPISQIREDLSEDHQRLWRGDNRGKPRARELMNAISHARTRANEAAREEQGLRAALAEQIRLEQQLADDGTEKASLERIARDAPYLRDLFELNQRVLGLGAQVDLAPLDGRPLVDPESLAGEIAELEKGLAGPQALLAREPVARSDPQRAAIAAAAEIGVAVDEAARHGGEQRSAAEGAARAAAQRAQAERALAGVLTQGAEPADLEGVAALPLAQLRSAQSGWARSWEEHVAAPAPGGGRAPVWSLPLAVVGGSVAVASLFLGWNPWIAAAGLFATVLGAGAAFFGRSTPRREEQLPPARPIRIDEILEGLPVAPLFAARPAELLRLIDVLGEVQHALAGAEREQAEANRLERNCRERERAWAALAERLGLDAGGDGALVMKRLRQAWDDARGAEKRVEQDAGERRQAETTVEAKTPELERRRAHLEAIESTLRRAEPGAASLHDAYRSVSERLKGHDFVRARETQLAADPRWNEFGSDHRVTAERAPDDADWLEEIEAKRGARIEELEAAIAAANQLRGELRSRLQQDEGSRSARAQDDVLFLEEELGEVKRERDRLALLDSILERAEREFREEHQPDVLRRAGGYLARVTHGRYHRLYYLEGEEAGLHVACEDRSEPAPVGAPISRGTLDQIFLCLRLGLLDHLDQGREKLPLILDDALLRMDDERRPKMYALLADIAPTRQVFLLTCHATIADEAEEALEASRIDLSLE